jgi:hypothetical protein
MDSSAVRPKITKLWKNQETTSTYSSGLRVESIEEMEMEMG